jgi:hypothetical protein
MVAELPVLSPEAFVALPQCVRRLVVDPPSASEWVATVHYNALVSCLYDVRFGRGRLGAFDRAAFDRGKELIGGPIYRVAFALMGPQRLVRARERRWGLFHRGSVLHVTRSSDTSREHVLESPPYLLSDVVVRTLCQSMRAAVTAAGASEVVVAHDALSPTTIQLTIRWREGAELTPLVSRPRAAQEGVP